MSQIWMQGQAAALGHGRAPRIRGRACSRRESSRMRRMVLKQASQTFAGALVKAERVRQTERGPRCGSHRAASAWKETVGRGWGQRPSPAGCPI